MILGESDPRMKHPLGDGQSVPDFFFIKWTKRSRYLWDVLSFFKINLNKFKYF
jgi:hypothetical protein